MTSFATIIIMDWTSLLTGGKDYTDFISTVVPIPVGSTVGTLVCTTLFVTNDNILEDTEQLSIYLSSNDIAAIIPHGMSSYTILEDPYDSEFSCD